MARFVATQDIAADGLAVETLTSGERGRVMRVREGRETRMVDRFVRRYAEPNTAIARATHPGGHRWIGDRGRARDYFDVCFPLLLQHKGGRNEAIGS